MDDLQRYLQTIYLGSLAAILCVILLISLLIMLAVALGRINDIKTMVKAIAPIESLPFQEREREIARRNSKGTA